MPAVWDARSALVGRYRWTRILGRSSAFPSTEDLGARNVVRCLREGYVVSASRQRR